METKPGTWWRRRGWWLVAAVVALLLLGAGVTWKWRQPAPWADRNCCACNLIGIDGAKEQYALSHHLRDGDPITWEQVMSFIKNPEVYVCPRGETYSVNPIGRDPTCSYPGHSLIP